MSRHPAIIDTSQAELEEEEAISGTGEGDEVMEEVEEQDDGYSCVSIYPKQDAFFLLTTNSMSSASSTPTSTLTWISWFCSLPGHEYFCEVTEDFIEDDFNLTGLSTMVPFWKEAMEMVLDVEPGESYGLHRSDHARASTNLANTDEDASKIPDVSIVESSAEMLYGLVHQRYILTRMGLQAMVRSPLLREGTLAITLALGGQIRERHIWLLSSSLLRWLQRRSLREIRHTRS